MRQGYCTECGSATVRAARNALAGLAGHTGQGSHTGMWPHFAGPPPRGVRAAFTGELWSYACITCGHFEFRVHDPATLDFIARNWVRVPVEGEPPAQTSAPS